MSSEDIGNLQKRTPQGQEAANSKDEKIPRNEAMKALHETPLEGLLKLATRAQLDETELRAVLNTRRANELRSTTQPGAQEPEYGHLQALQGDDFIRALNKVEGLYTGPQILDADDVFGIRK